VALEDRLTVRLDESMLQEMRAAARRRGVSLPHYAREAWARQLGRDTCLDEIDRLRQAGDDRHEQLERQITGFDRRLRRIEGRVG
jgi:hypothetical protein